MLRSMSGEGKRTAPATPRLSSTLQPQQLWIGNRGGRRPVSAVGSDYAGPFERDHRRFAQCESSGDELLGMRVCRAAPQRPAQRCEWRPTARRCGSGGAKRALQIDVRERELGLVGASRGNSEVNASHAGAHLSAELEQLEANGLG